MVRTFNIPVRLNASQRSNLRKILPGLGGTVSNCGKCFSHPTNWTECLFDCRKCTKCHLMSISNLQNPQQDRSLKIMCICIVQLFSPHAKTTSMVINDVSFVPHKCQPTLTSSSPDQTSEAALDISAFNKTTTPVESRHSQAKNYEKLVPCGFVEKQAQKASTALCSAVMTHGCHGAIGTLASTWAPAVGRPSESAGCLAARKKKGPREKKTDRILNVVCTLKSFAPKSKSYAPLRSVSLVVPKYSKQSLIS